MMQQAIRRARTDPKLALQRFPAYLYDAVKKGWYLVQDLTTPSQANRLELTKGGEFHSDHAILVSLGPSLVEGVAENFIVLKC